MSMKDSLRPLSSQRVMDLVAEAGIDVSHWAMSMSGPVRVPAANPAHCYEWSFVEEGEVVVVNVWHAEIQETQGAVWLDLSLREWANGQRKSSVTRRAGRMDAAIAHAFDNRLNIRVIVGDGPQRDQSDTGSEYPSQMKRRLLDGVAWTVVRYDNATGRCRLQRGVVAQFIDQFSVSSENGPEQRDAYGKVFVRDPKVRAAALARAQGTCECCDCFGFLTPHGGIFLETHHITPLSDGGLDNKRNVAAICPNCHREAHYGEGRNQIRDRLVCQLVGVYGPIRSKM